VIYIWLNVGSDLVAGNFVPKIDEIRTIRARARG
jgi:hypothetical protein